MGTSDPRHGIRLNGYGLPGLHGNHIISSKSQHFTYTHIVRRKLFGLVKNKMAASSQGMEEVEIARRKRSLSAMNISRLGRSRSEETIPLLNNWCRELQVEMEETG